MRSRSVGITGATGFLGWHVAQAFLRAGWQVRGIVRPGSRKPLPEAAERIEASLDTPSLGWARVWVNNSGDWVY